MQFGEFNHVGEFNQSGELNHVSGECNHVFQ
jgi:hypothetical protein